MNWQAIPDELKGLRQWVIWRTIVNDEGRPTKPPYQARLPQYGASVTRPDTWATFDEAVAACTRHPDLAQGIGFVFTENDPYFGIDIDSESKVAAEHRETRRTFAAAMLEGELTYTEFSPSGEGYHIIGRGTLPEAGKRVTKLQVEAYGSQRFFTFTGHVYNGRTVITDQQEFLDWVYANLEGASQSIHPTTVDVSDGTRRVDLSDQEVLRLCHEFHPTFWTRYSAQTGCEPGEWSDTFMAVVGIVDRFTGSVEQVQRLIMDSGMVQNAVPSAAGETREAKAKRTLPATLTRVRQGNNGQLYFVNHGRQVWEAIERTKAERAHEAAEALRNAETAILGRRIMDAFPMLTDAHRTLTRPPGVMGEYVEACERYTLHPYTKFAVPATLAALSGTVARSYKLPNGGGLNLNFILAAPSSTGKSNTADAWTQFMHDANEIVGNNLAGAAKSRILAQGTSSIQGIFEDFMDVPSVCWVIDECASQLMSMSNATTQTEIQLRDSFNTLFDVGRHGRMFTPPRSVANRRANITPINNLCVSTFWTTTDSKFDVFSNDALDGFLSRVVVVRHKGRAGDMQDEDRCQRHLPAHLRDRLVQLLEIAKRVDEAYAINPGQAISLLVNVDASQVRSIAQTVLRIVERIKNASLDGTLPSTYTALSRLPVTAMRVAGVLAVIDNPFMPIMTVEHYLWSFGYLMQNTLNVLDSMDSGELGNSASDEVLAIVRGYKEMLKMPEYRKTNGLPRTKLRDYVKTRKPFVNEIRAGRSHSKLVTETFEYMIKEGMLVEIDGNNGKPGRAPKLLCPTDDTIWTNE